MGSWNISCTLTRAPLGRGADVYFFPILPVYPESPGSTTGYGGWDFAGPPIRGLYDEYGRLDDVDESSVGVRWLRAIIDDQTTDINEIISEMRMENRDLAPLRYVPVDAAAYDDAVASIGDFRGAVAPWDTTLPTREQALAIDPDDFGTMGMSVITAREARTAEQALCAHYPLHMLTQQTRKHMPFTPPPEPVPHIEAFAGAPTRCAALVDDEVIEAHKRAEIIFAAAGAVPVPTLGLGTFQMCEDINIALSMQALAVTKRYWRR